MSAIEPRIINAVPGDNDATRMVINHAEMKYNQAMGRVFYSTAATDYWKTAKIAYAAISELQTEPANSPMREKYMVKCVKLWLVSAIYSTACYLFSFIGDAYIRYKLNQESNQFPEGRTLLLIIDAQKDFSKAGKYPVDGKMYEVPEGNLGVTDGYGIVQGINNLINENPDWLVAASLDYHPPTHRSFLKNNPELIAAYKEIDDNEMITDKDAAKKEIKLKINGLDQIPWPAHCVQGTPGADFLPGLNVGAINYIVRKGLDDWTDSYSCFYDNGHHNESTMAEWAKAHNVKDIVLVGIATDFCVKESAIDAKQRYGFYVLVRADLCRSVFPNPSAALHAMTSKGIQVQTTGY